MATGLGSTSNGRCHGIVWGLFSSTVLTLFVVPVLYAILPPRNAPQPVPEPAGEGVLLVLGTT